MKHLSPVAVCLMVLAGLPGSAIAQSSHMNHDTEARAEASTPAEPGQGAFAAIAEIVEILRAEPDTDWADVDIEALRLHLIDMDNVTLRAAVESQPVEGGARYDVTSHDPAVAGSIRRMVVAHAAAMSGVDGMQMQADEISAGARLTVTGGNADMIRGLGFIGLMTVGMHHQAHHLALARGSDPHRQ